MATYLLPLAFDQPEEAIQRIQECLKTLQANPNLSAFMRQALDAFSQQPQARCAMAVIGSSREELTAELERALDALPRSLESGREWQTPAGSYFTPQPLGPLEKEEKIAFVYPGAFGTYVGMGRSIFYLFPQLYDALQTVSEDPGKTINEQVIFPSDLTPQLKEELQAELNDNPTEMISSGVCFSHLYTFILQDIFNIQPQAVFGYSLGENSMMFATGIWSQADGMRTSLEGLHPSATSVSPDTRMPSGNTGVCLLLKKMSMTGSPSGSIMSSWRRLKRCAMPCKAKSASI